MSGFRMDDYVPVNERIERFLERYPDGSMQSEIVELTSSRVTVKAFAYRTPDDPRPGIGHSSLDIPGSTSFTRGSEIENAETSAWGRAIAALGFEVKRGLASAEEVRNKQPEPSARGESAASSIPSGAHRSAPASPDLRGRLLAAVKARAMSSADLDRLAAEMGVPPNARATDAQLRAMLARLEQPGQDAEVPTAMSPVPAPREADDPADQSRMPQAAAGSDPPTESSPVASPSLEDILDATGGELLPPEPGSDEYRALPAHEKAAARAYWAQQKVAAR